MSLPTLHGDEGPPGGCPLTLTTTGTDTDPLQMVDSLLTYLGPSTVPGRTPDLTSSRNPPL